MLKFPATLKANRLEAGAAFSRLIRADRLDFSAKNTRIAREHGGKGRNHDGVNFVTPRYGVDQARPAVFEKESTPQHLSLPGLKALQKSDRRLTCKRLRDSVLPGETFGSGG
jgi:hypothetical protein